MILSKQYASSSKLLGFPSALTKTIFFRALFDIQGWTAYARYRVWDNALNGRAYCALVELLAIRLAWGYALFRERPDPAFKDAWAAAMADSAQRPNCADLDAGDLLALRAALQQALESAYQRRLVV